MARGSVIVVDIGKTLSKLTLWSRDGRLMDRQVRGTERCVEDGIARLDAAGIGAWLIEAMGRYRGAGVTHIVPVAHGAGAAVLHGDCLAFAPLDYEQSIPAEVLEAYRRKRDPFEVTGSPALPEGLNLGCQLAWLDRLHPDAMAQGVLLPWAQYWAWFLSGAAVSEVTSLACHTDLWVPAEARFSPLAERGGWAARFAPLVAAGDVIGTLRAELAVATGLPAAVRIHAGLHDSNAALLAARGFPEIADREATVLSTGTWFVAMRSPAEAVDPAALPEDRDCLVNVDVAGRAVPSARFMGGRELELLGARIDHDGIAGLADVLHADAAILPSQVPGCGPFPNAFGRWINRPDDPVEQAAAAALYVALMADTALDLIGAKERLLIEGRFARSEIFTRALAALRPDTRVFVAAEQGDVSFGALRMLDPGITQRQVLTAVEPLDRDLTAYREEWHDDIAVFS